MRLPCIQKLTKPGYLRRLSRWLFALIQERYYLKLFQCINWSVFSKLSCIPSCDTHRFSEKWCHKFSLDFSRTSLRSQVRENGTRLTFSSFSFLEICPDSVMFSLCPWSFSDICHHLVAFNSFGWTSGWKGKQCWTDR